MDQQIKNNARNSAVMDTFTVQGMASNFQRKCTPEMEIGLSEKAHENYSHTAVEKLSVEQIKFRWRRQQIENQEKQLTHLDSSWKLKQLFGWPRKQSYLRNDTQNFSYFDGNPSEIRRDSMFGDEFDANPSAQIAKSRSILLTASFFWRRSQASKN
jgi:hypothetical protein